MSAVTDMIARFAVAIDDHDWAAVTSCLGDEVRRDYSSLTGTSPDLIAGPELVAEWAAVLEGLDAHQHLIGLPTVEIDGTEAHAAAHVVGTHVLQGDPDSPWVVGGTYRFVLRRTVDDDRWQIVALTLDTRWQTGDGAVLQRAAAS